MKIMIFGDSGSGKSTFAKKLGHKLELPVFHLDSITNKIGRQKHHFNQINQEIIKIAQKDRWVIDGNCFSREKNFRIKQADLILIFHLHPIQSFGSHIKRTFQTKLNKEKPLGGLSGKFDLPFFIPYIFWRFPRRKKQMIAIAKKLDKEILFVQSRKDLKKAEKILTQKLQQKYRV